MVIVNCLHTIKIIVSGLLAEIHSFLLLRIHFLFELDRAFFKSYYLVLYVFDGLLMGVEAKLQITPIILTHSSELIDHINFHVSHFLKKIILLVILLLVSSHHSVIQLLNDINCILNNLVLIIELYLEIVILDYDSLKTLYLLIKDFLYLISPFLKHLVKPILDSANSIFNILVNVFSNGAHIESFQQAVFHVSFPIDKSAIGLPLKIEHQLQKFLILRIIYLISKP